MAGSFNSHPQIQKKAISFVLRQIHCLLDKDFLCSFATNSAKESNVIFIEIEPFTFNSLVFEQLVYMPLASSDVC